jgi:PAT family beta-lactamase induction signal transducer AmpG
VTPALENSPRLRLMTLCLMYLAQGMPFGFVTGTLVTFLATKGYGVKEIAGITFMAQLPWTFKFIWGPIIDRFDFHFLAMGRRRLWILFAQSMMTITLLLILLLPDPAKVMTTLLWIIAVHNVFASLQDVSVDALAVDLLPENERGKANGFMRAASYLGHFIGGAVMGVLTARHGLHLAISLQAIIMIIVMMAPLFLREREGERLFPWNPLEKLKQTTTPAVEAATASAGALFKSFRKAFSLPSTLLAAALALIIMVGQHTISIISKPLFTQELGWSMEAYSKWITGGGYFFALGGSLLGGLLADRFTAKRTAGTATVVLGIVWIAFSMMEQHWGNRTLTVGFIFAEQFSIGIMTVSLFSIFMSVSWPVIAGTQFTTYMALLNVSGIAGTKLAGEMGDSPDYTTIYLGAGIAQIAFLLLLKKIDVGETRRELGELG